MRNLCYECPITNIARPVGNNNNSAPSKKPQREATDPEEIERGRKNIDDAPVYNCESIRGICDISGGG